MFNPHTHLRDCVHSTDIEAQPESRAESRPTYDEQLASILLGKTFGHYLAEKLSAPSRASTRIV